MAPGVGRGGGRSGGGRGRAPRSVSRHAAEVEEIEALEAAIKAGAPAPGTSTLAAVSKGAEVRAAAAAAGSVAPMAAARNFEQLPLSRATLEGLKAAKYKAMTAIQRAALPHALAGRDVLGAAKTGSGKTLAFLLPVSVGVCGVGRGHPASDASHWRALTLWRLCARRLHVCPARSSWRSSFDCAGRPATAWAPSCCRPRASWPCKSSTRFGAPRSPLQSVAALR